MPRSFTHDHADHLFGLDDLRMFPHYLGHSMPVYCEEHVEERIRKSFDYAFAAEAKAYAGASRNWSSSASGWSPSRCLVRE